MATGTYECQICFRDTPHEHSGLEVHRYREEQIEWNTSRMEELQKLSIQQKARAQKLAGAQAALVRYERACHFCRDLPHGGERLKFDCGWLYGLVIDRTKDTAGCPECGSILAAWE
jgi:hypothetical protein